MPAGGNGPGTSGSGGRGSGSANMGGPFSSGSGSGGGAVAKQNKSAKTYITINPTRSLASQKGYRTRVAREAARERARLKAARSAGVKATIKKSTPIVSGVAALAYAAGRLTDRKEIVEAKKIFAARKAKKPVKSGSAQAKAYNKTLKKVKGDATKIPGFTMGRNTY